MNIPKIPSGKTLLYSLLLLSTGALQSTLTGCKKEEIPAPIKCTTINGTNDTLRIHNTDFLNKIAINLTNGSGEFIEGISKTPQGDVRFHTQNGKGEIHSNPLDSIFTFHDPLIYREGNKIIIAEEQDRVTATIDAKQANSDCTLNEIYEFLTK